MTWGDYRLTFPDADAPAETPLVAPEVDRDYLTLTGLGLLCLTFIGLVGLGLPLLTGR